MDVVQLASVDDVEAALGRDLTADEELKVESILDKASELFRAEARQQFTAGRSEVRVKVNGGRVFLRERPVTEVHTVTDERGGEVAFTQFKQWLDVPLRSHQFVIVDYEHGGEVPDLVRLTVADVARQVLTISADASVGVTQTSNTAGPMTSQVTYAAWAVGGATRLSPEDISVARSFRVKVPNVWVQGA